MVVDLYIFFEPGIWYLSSVHPHPFTIYLHIPRALNSNLTKPSSGPFSKTSTLSLLLLFPFTEARKAEFEESTAFPLVRMEGLMADMGTQNCGKYLCSHTCLAVMVSKI